MIEKYLAEVSPMSEIELEEHLAPQCNMPPKIVPSGKASVDCITEFLLTNKQDNSMSAPFHQSSIIPSDGMHEHLAEHDNSYLVQCNHRLNLVHGSLVSLLSPSKLSCDLFHGSPLFALLFLESRF